MLDLKASPDPGIYLLAEQVSRTGVWHQLATVLLKN